MICVRLVYLRKEARIVGTQTPHPRKGRSVMPVQKIYAVMRTYADGTGGWGKQWQASGTRTLDYPTAIAAAARLDEQPRNRVLGWRFYAARVA
jgi:hypothetical protein